MKVFVVTKRQLDFGLGENTTDWRFTVRARKISDVKKLLKLHGFDSHFVTVYEVRGNDMAALDRFLKEKKR